MESFSSQDVYSTATLVQQYLQNAESLWRGVDERSHLAQLCSECILLFRIILNTLRGNDGCRSNEWHMMKISLERSYGRLKIWSEENGAADGSLDATLAASRDLQRDALKYIVSISQTLTERLINVVGMNVGEDGHESVSVLRSLTAAATEDDDDDESGSEFSDSSSDSVNSILEDLRVDTTCLLDLEPLLCSPILRNDPDPAAIPDTTQITWSPHQAYSDKISVRFPKAADYLVTKLGKANYERYLRCQTQKAANEVGDLSPDQTTFVVPDSASSKFHDSGIGTSVPTSKSASAYADTVMSYGTGEARRVRVPPLPARAKEGLPFKCLACGKWLKITNNSAWKRHIYGDLEPWICLEQDCVSAIDTFRTRIDWISHLSHNHGMDPKWPMMDCRLCRVEIGPGKLSITRHLSDHLEEISLSALTVDCEFTEESEDTERDREDDRVENTDPRAWLNGLALFHKARGRQLRSLPALRKKQLSLFDLNLAVEGLGGYDEVSECKAWEQICRELGVRLDDVAETASDLQNAYKEWIIPYDESRRQTQERVDEPSNAPSIPVGADPVIVKLAEKANEDPLWRELMKRVANGEAPKDELARFQAIIDQITAELKRKGISAGQSGDQVLVDGRSVRSIADETNAIIARVLKSNPKQTSSDLVPLSGSDPLVGALVKRALDDQKTLERVRRIVNKNPDIFDATNLRDILNGLKNDLGSTGRSSTEI